MARLDSVDKIIISKDYCKDTAGSSLSLGIKRVFIVADDNVSKIYLDRLRNALVDEAIDVFEYIASNGESAKSFDEYLKIINFMIAKEASRSDAVISLGGGVVGDLAGFVAGTYMRGMKLIHIPTSLLAMVDSSIGGKTAINVNSIKNIVGVFKRADLTIIDKNFIKTLAYDEILCGVSEIIKIAILADRLLFDDIAKSSFVNRLGCNSGDKTIDLQHIGDFKSIINRSIYLKKEIVEKDIFDNGNRKLLNLGHTTAHAIEKVLKNRVKHGIAVAFGTLVSLETSKKLGIFNADIEDETRIKTLVYKTFSKNSDFKKCFTIDENKIAEAIKFDKKKVGSSKIEFVCIEKIGQSKLINVDIKRISEIMKESIVKMRKSCFSVK